jgi:hypothetical protein
VFDLRRSSFEDGEIPDVAIENAKSILDQIQDEQKRIEGVERDLQNARVAAAKSGERPQVATTTVSDGEIDALRRRAENIREEVQATLREAEEIAASASASQPAQPPPQLSASSLIVALDSLEYMLQRGIDPQ